MVSRTTAISVAAYPDEVTLNITVVHPLCVYVASDFRLFDVDRGEPVNEPSMKVIEVGFEGGAVGLITYTGIGRVGSKSTAEFVCDWLDGAKGLDLPEVAEILRSSGTTWIKRLNLRERPRHTFVLAGYGRESRPTLYVISNFQKANGETRDTATSELATTALFVRSTRVLVTGVHQAVRRERRKLLARTVTFNPLDSSRIRDAMVRMNADAAETPLGAKFISPGAGVASLLPQGAGRLRLSSPHEVDLYQLMDGVRMPGTAELAARGIDLKGYRLVESLTVRDTSAPVHQDSCSRSVVGPDATLQFSLEELPLVGDGHQWAVAIDQEGTVLAASSEAANPGLIRHWLWEETGSVRFLPLVNPSFFTAGGFARGGQVFVMAGGHHLGPSRILRVVGDEVNELPSHDGLPTGLSAVEPSGWVAGFAEVLSDDTRADRHQPARWTPQGELQVASGLPAGYSGTALAITSDGTAVVGANAWGLPALTLLWLPSGELVAPQPPAGTAHLGLVGISETGGLVGSLTAADGRVAVVGTFEDGLTRVDAPVDWTPSVASPNGRLAGSYPTARGNQPWAMSPSQGAVSLPNYRHHSAAPAGINDRGWVIGTAAADHCVHAVLWKPVNQSR